MSDLNITSISKDDELIRIWKLRAKDWWVNGSKSVMLHEIVGGKKRNEIWWRVRLATGGFNDIPQTSLTKHSFKTKLQALKYAQEYMRKN